MPARTAPPEERQRRNREQAQSARKGSGHRVQNCLIYDVGYGGTYTAAITVEVGTHDSKILQNWPFGGGRRRRRFAATEC